MHVCVCACMYACMCVHVYAGVCEHVHVHAGMCMHMHLGVCLHMYAGVCVYACMCVCMYVCVHVCMHVCVYMCMQGCVSVCMCMQVHSGVTPRELSAFLFESDSLIRTWGSPIRLAYKPHKPTCLHLPITRIRSSFQHAQANFFVNNDSREQTQVLILVWQALSPLSHLPAHWSPRAAAGHP